MWQEWVNGLVGLWLIVAAFLDMSASAIQMNLLVSGIVIAVLAIWSGIAEQQHHHSTA